MKSPTSHPRTGSSVNSKPRSSVSRNTNIDARPRQRQGSSSPQIASPSVFNGVTWTGESRAYQSSPNNHIIFQSDDVDTIDSRRSKTVGHVISGRKVSLTRSHEAGGTVTDGPVDATDRPQRPPSLSCPSSTQTAFPLKRGGLQDGDTLPQPSTAESPKTDPILSAYHEVLQRLAAKRRVANRPDELLDMTLEELEEEKSVIQRTLLSFEKTYGRPRERHERVIMRPVYDRYRSVKRLLASAGSHRCTSPNTPARVFVSNGQGNGTGDLSDEPEPLLLAPPSTTTGTGCAETIGFISPKTTSIHSDKSTSAQHVNLIRTREGGFVVPEHRVSSVEAHAYPRVQATSTNRCTSLMLSISSQAPDEWFGSLGVSTRPSYCLSSPQRYLETEEMAAEQFVEQVTSVQGDLVASDEGNRTPVYQTPTPPQRKPRRKTELPVWVAPSEASGQGKSPSHLPRKSLIISTDPCHQQQQHNRVLSGDDDSEDHSISDYISRYSTFTLSQLQTELKFVKESKKSLQKYLKEFEHEFLRNHGRKVDTIGREPLYSEYHKYKMLKVRLTCLERLIEARSGKR